MQNNRNYIDTVIGNFIEVELTKDFNLVAETLTRIGSADARGKKLYQSCHILQKRGKYYVVHFKEMFLLDGKPATLTEEDFARRNAIAFLLHNWGLLKINDLERVKNRADHVFVLKHDEVDDWELVAKYTFSGKRRKQSVG